MFALALLFGIYSYLLFVLGLVGLFNKESILGVSIIFLILSAYYFYTHKSDIPKINLKNKKIRPLLILFLVLAGVNLIGALAPEFSFDALWYHLSLPKIFLQNNSFIYAIEGNFYYSVMPKLGEMLFTPFIAFNFDVLAKLVQWIFGILTSIVIYKISRRYFDEIKSFLAVLIFYSSLIIAWESTVAYVDLIRAFFEVMGLWGFLVWRETRDRKILIESAIFIGLAVSTKLLAMGSIIIFIILFFSFEKDKIFAFKNSFLFTVVVLLSVSPWLILAFLITGNPIFPIFSEVYPSFPVNYFLLPSNFLNDMFTIFVKADIPISPLYLIFLPFALILYKKFDTEFKILSIYFFMALVIWYFTPRTGGGRFFLAYLPIASIICVGVIAQFKNKILYKYSYYLIILVFASTIFYRGIANARYIPVVLGIETRDDFLASKLNFDFGDFYDTDSFFENNINDEDVVLLYGFHNLYYVNFPFIHIDFVKKGDRFNYIATQKVDLPERFINWELVHENSVTNVKIYRDGENTWRF